MLAGDMPKQVVPVPPPVAAGSMIANTRDGTVDRPATAGGTDRIQQRVLILSEGVDSYIGADSALAVLPARKHERQ